jgi:hypothetical protein
MNSGQGQFCLARVTSGASAGFAKRIAAGFLRERRIPGGLFPGGFFLLAALFLLSQSKVRADAGGYSITQLAITNATHPSINNTGEVVWAVQNGSGIFSSARGQLAATGVSPHIANSGEVVYADSFGGPGMDLVSTTRGRLTQGGIIQLGFSDFGVNASGEVVYVAPDTNDNQQVYSTVRGQVSFDAVDHYNPCINDLGEILWNRYGEGPGLVSSTRGPLPGYYPTVYGLNNYEEFCYAANLDSGGLSTSPHLFSSIHGVVINDAFQFQFGGAINDAGTMVWAAQTSVSGSTQFVFQATWVPSPVLTLVNTSGLTLQWPTNASAFHAQYSTNLAPPIVWQRLDGNLMTNSGNFEQTISQSIGGTAFFRLSTSAP